MASLFLAVCRSSKFYNNPCIFPYQTNAYLLRTNKPAHTEALNLTSTLNRTIVMKIFNFRRSRSNSSSKKKDTVVTNYRDGISTFMLPDIFASAAPFAPCDLPASSSVSASDASDEAPSIAQLAQQRRATTKAVEDLTSSVTIAEPAEDCLQTYAKACEGHAQYSTTVDSSLGSLLSDASTESLQAHITAISTR